MGIASAFYTALSGLSVNSSSLTVIGNNLANLNTIGFKGSSTTFQDLFSTTLGARAFQGNGNPSQVGLGAMVGAVMQNFGQSTFQSTSNVLDMAVQGAGFFSVRLNGTSGAVGYTRAGNFTINQAGWLVDPAGNFVQGWTRDNQGNINVTQPPAGTDIRIPVGEVVPAYRTEHITFTTNLDPSVTPANSRYNSSIQVYDSLGGKHTVIVTYERVPATQNEWYYYVHSPDTNPPTGVPPAGMTMQNYIDGAPIPPNFHVPLAAGVIKFGNNGSMIDPSTGDLWPGCGIAQFDYDPAAPPATGADFLPTVGGTSLLQPFGSNNPTIPFTPTAALAPNTIAWNNGSAPQPLEWIINKGSALAPIMTLTQLEQPSGTTNSFQNGYGAGSIKGLTVDQNGYIMGTFTNGQTYALGQVALSTFANNNGLQKAGENIWMETIASGAPSTGVANDVGRGTVLGSHLEMSNVDVADEFTRLIITQRGYQANSRIVTTSDEMMQETLALKR
jgi:flagellar hook protein FlgE